MYYTGIGARKTPFEVQLEMIVFASILGEAQYTLRSGGAAGADTAFEVGCDKVAGKRDIFLPWRGFKQHSSDLFKVSSEALDLAREVHPAWDRLSPAGRLLHGRNAYQVLGQDLATPSKFLICWTVDGEIIGGTATGIRLANKFDIPVFNLAHEHDQKCLGELMLHEAAEYAAHHTAGHTTTVG